MTKGQRFKAQVVELQINQQVLVTCQGRLLRVTNQTGKSFQVNDLLDLIVVSSHPLQLKIFQELKGFQRHI